MHGRSLVATRRLVCLCADPTDPVVAHVRSWAETRDISVTVEPVGSTPATPDVTGTLAVAVGGDGTVLEAVRVFAPREIPVLGIDRGRLSFLPRVLPDQATAALAEVLRGEAAVGQHQRFAVTGGGLDTTGINDVTVEPPQGTDTHRTVTLSVFVDEEYLGTHEGGGAVVSTPTGSTAMALSAGGPIHSPEGDTLQFTPLHPTRLGSRSVTFDAGRTLTAIARDTVAVSIDGGRATETLRSGDSLQVTGTDRPAHVVRTSTEYSFFAALATKLDWLHGERGRRDSGFESPGRLEDALASADCDAFERDVWLAREAAIAAGDLVVKHLREQGRGAEAVETAIARAELVLTTAIDCEYPDDVVSVGGEVPDGRVWVVDAVDGRTNLEHGNPNYATSIALLVDGRPMVGVVYAPVSGECFHGIRGRGAVRNGAPIEPTDRDTLAESMLLSGYDPDGEFLQTCYRHARGVRRIGSQALSLCYVAAGSADACWEFDTRPRDVAAGLCLLRAAGGRASTPGGGPFRLDGVDRTPLLASNGPLHPALLGLLVSD